MPTFMADYQCENCGVVSEMLVHTTMDRDTWEMKEDLIGCPECGSLKMVQVLSGNPTKLHDKEVLKETLKKRSADHTLREMRKTAGWKTGALPKNFGRTKQH